MESVKDIERWYVQNNADVAKSDLDGHLKMQKLLYYSQAMSLVVDGTVIFQNDFEAWPNGPVVREAHYDYKVGKIAECTPPKTEVCFGERINESTLKILNIINYIYGSQPASKLIELTHEEKPWKELEELAVEKKNPIITKESIREFYKSLLSVFEVYKDENFETKKTVELNSNYFVYDEVETSISDEEMLDLWGIGLDTSGERFFVYKDNGELVAY